MMIICEICLNAFVDINMSYYYYECFNYVIFHTRFGTQIWGAGSGRAFLLAMIDATDKKPSGQVGHMFVTVHPIHSIRGSQCFTNIISIYGPLIMYRVGA